MLKLNRIELSKKNKNHTYRLIINLMTFLKPLNWYQSALLIKPKHRVWVHKQDFINPESFHLTPVSIILGNKVLQVLFERIICCFYSQLTMSLLLTLVKFPRSCKFLIGKSGLMYLIFQNLLSFKLFMG